MMDSLRNFLSGPRLFIVIATCTLPFVFLGTSSLTTVFGGSVGTINGENVTETDLQVASNMAVQKYRSIYGDDFDFSSLDDEIQLNIIREELILQKVLLSEARSLGLINNVASTQSKKNIISNPSFWLDGKFNEDIYEAQVNSNGHTKESYIELMTDIVASEIYRTALSSSNFSTKQETQELAYLFEQSADINFIKIDSNALRENIINTKDELLDFYDLNQFRFYSNEKRSFNYFILNPESYRDSVVVPEDFLENSYSEYVSKSGDSTQIRLSHIMVDKLNYDNSDQAFNIINDVQKKLSNGESFESLAARYSEDIVTKDNGGDLEYFDADVFPIEFSDAIASLNLNDVSNIIELETSIHILKITEYNKEEILSIDQMKDTIISELVDTESIALMNDDVDLIDEMLLSNNSIDMIAESLSKKLISSDMYSLEEFSFDLDDPIIKEYLFSSEANTKSTVALNLDESIIVLSLSGIEESVLQDFEAVQMSVNNLLSKDKAIEKQSLLAAEIELAKIENSVDSFIGEYKFISKDSFVDVKRYSSLLPREVILEIFQNAPGSAITINANNGDTYVVDLLNINKPSDIAVAEVSEEFEQFSKERIATKISEIINEDIFTSAKVDLSNLVF